MVSSYEDIDELLDDLKSDIIVSIHEAKRDYIDFQMVEAIDELIYQGETYATNPYQEYGSRGENGGLKDKDNFEMTPLPTASPNELEFMIRNVTTGNTNFSGATSGMIDSIIVGGYGYTWKNSEYYRKEHEGKPIKRDFYQATLERIDGKVGTLIEQKLKEKGW